MFMCILSSFDTLSSPYVRALYSKDEYASEGIEWIDVGYGVDLRPTIEFLVNPGYKGHAFVSVFSKNFFVNISLHMLVCLSSNYHACIYLLCERKEERQQRTPFSWLVYFWR